MSEQPDLEQEDLAQDAYRDSVLREGLLTERTSTLSAPSEEEPGQPSRLRIGFVPVTADGERTDGPVRDVRVPAGVSVFDAASWNGIAIDSTCGGHGTCRKCRVRVVGGQVPVSRLDPRAFTTDQLRQGWRLACLATPRQDVEVEVPPLLTRPKAATVGVGRQVILRPAVQKRFVELAEPTLSDQRTDVQRLLDGIEDLAPRPDLYAVRRLPKVLRESDFKVTAVIVDEALIDVEPGDTTGLRYAIAYDLGTTTVVATLLDLSTGTPVAVRSMLNRQQNFGGDVISRISATMLDDAALGRLRAAAQQTLAELTREVCAEGEVEPGWVYEVALAGNATMVHLVLGIEPEALGVAPFVMSSKDFPDLLAGELGLGEDCVHPRARAYVFPALGAYVGGDIVSGLLASGMDRDRRLRLFIDVGTNCEIVLGDPSRLLSTAAPAGPAFEGASIRCGMRAADGAIEVVKLSPDGVAVQVIGDVEPVGLCGSGLVDAVAELSAMHLLDASGRLHRPPNRPASDSRDWPIGWPNSTAARGSSSSIGAARSGPSTTPSTCPSATCANCSSPRPRSRPAGGCCCRSTARTSHRSSRCCWPARSAPTCRPPAPSGSDWSPGSRCCGS